jgi:hypothetical protein
LGKQQQHDVEQQQQHQQATAVVELPCPAQATDPGFGGVVAIAAAAAAAATAAATSAHARRTDGVRDSCVCGGGGAQEDGAAAELARLIVSTFESCGGSIRPAADEAPSAGAHGLAWIEEPAEGGPLGGSSDDGAPPAVPAFEAVADVGLPEALKRLAVDGGGGGGGGGGGCGGGGGGGCGGVDRGKDQEPKDPPATEGAAPWQQVSRRGGWLIECGASRVVNPRQRTLASGLRPRSSLDTTPVRAQLPCPAAASPDGRKTGARAAARLRGELEHVLELLHEADALAAALEVRGERPGGGCCGGGRPANLLLGPRPRRPACHAARAPARAAARSAGSAFPPPTNPRRLLYGIL